MAAGGDKMTDKDKQIIAKIDLLKIKSMTKRVNNLTEINEELYYLTQGGGIDYSKDHIQTSPMNILEETLTRICDNDREIKRLNKEIQNYKNKIYKVNDKRYKKILFRIYIQDKSLGSIVKEDKYKYKSNVEYIHKKALVAYYNTTYCYK